VETIICVDGAAVGLAVGSNVGFAEGDNVGSIVGGRGTNCSFVQVFAQIQMLA
jgi:hypothetical protein